MKRRDFLRTTAAVAAPLVIPRRVLSAPDQPGANDRIRADVIGCGFRIAAVITESPKDVQIAAQQRAVSQALREAQQAAAKCPA
jgi:hypothetical protein